MRYTPQDEKEPRITVAAKSRDTHHPARNTSPSMEQYIETIGELLLHEKVCSVSEIADRAGVSRPAASRAIRDLSEKGLVEHRAYGYVDLTTEGQILAERLEARHEALRAFLERVLQMDEEAADREACRLEHHLDDGVTARIAAITEYFDTTPKARQQLAERLADIPLDEDPA